MEEGTGSDQPISNDRLNAESRSKINELVAKVNATIASPSTRALRVWEALRKEDLTIWDLMCFTVEAQGMMGNLFPQFQELIKQLNLAVYSTHYFHADDISQWEEPLPENIPDVVQQER